MTMEIMSTTGKTISTRRPGLFRTGPMAAAFAALLLAACSTTPEWTRPSTISDSITGQSPSEPTNETVAAQQAAAENSSDGAAFPAAGSAPKVPETGAEAEKRDLANSLVADRQHARYSGEALRGGTEPPASPLPSRRTAPLPDLPQTPGAASTGEQVASGKVIPAPEVPEFREPSRRIGEVKDGEYVPREEVVRRNAQAGREAAEEAAERTADNASDAVTKAASNKVEVATLPAPTSTPAPSAPAVQAAPAAPVAAPAPVRQATAAPARRPAVPATARPLYETEAAAQAAVQPSAAPTGRAATPVAASPAVTTGEPQFAASKAPPLPAEVLSQVPAVVSARFEETRVETGAPAAAPAQTGGDGVVIDYSAIGAGSPVPEESSYEQGSAAATPAYELLSEDAEGGPFTPVAIYFGHGSTALSAADRAEIRDIAALQKKRGGGPVRVVGHASSRTNNLPVEKHLLANFDTSLKRANAVAAELMKHGVAAADLVIEAEGDQAPVFYESMPAGEAGNRRAEIFLE